MYGKNNFEDEEKKTRPFLFLVVFLVIFFALSVLLYAIDFVPEPQSSSTDSLAAGGGAQIAHTSGNQAQGEEPVRVVIPKANIDTAVQNPLSTSIPILDNALLKGAVRYPDSGLLGENSGMLLFGHQSKLPVVHNQAFKAFNDLQALATGDEIIVFSETAKYRYRVASVKHVNVDGPDALVDLGDGTKTLTLVTCDSFGQKTDRYEVKADFVAKEPLS